MSLSNLELQMSLDSILGFLQVALIVGMIWAHRREVRSLRKSHSAEVEMIETFIGKGYQVKIYDRNVSLARLHGANQAYIQREIPHIASLMCNSVDEVLAASEVIVIGNKSPEFRQVLRHR